MTAFPGSLGCEIGGVDLAPPPDEHDFRAIERALHDHLVIVLHDQPGAVESLAGFGRRFGGLVPHILDQYHHPATSEVSIISNVAETGKGRTTKAPAGAFWHSDLSYQSPPAAATLLYGVEIPPAGGDTLFVNMIAAYEALPEATKRRLEGRKAIHFYRGARTNEDALVELTPAQRAKLPEVVHPLVRSHPVTGRKALFVNPGFTVAIVGMDRAESDAVLDELYAHATRPQFLYRHRWRKGDLIVNDNRATMHCATAGYRPDQHRTLFRMIVAGSAPDGG